MSILKNLLLLMIMIVGGVAVLNAISPNGNTIFEANQVVSELFSITSNSVAEIGNPFHFLQFNAN